MLKNISKVAEAAFIENASTEIEYDGTFESCWNGLIHDIDTKQRVSFINKTNKQMKIGEYGKDFISLIGPNATSPVPCTKKEMEEIWKNFPNVNEIKNIEKSFSEKKIGGNKTVKYAILNALQEWKSEHSGKKTKTSKANVKNYVLIIDEINRGNVSKIFGELISLLEADKRLGGNHHLSVILPYSKESFSIPSNLYIIGTMNTTDRSVGSIDYAVRRRFAFYTLKAERSALENYYSAEENSDLRETAIDRFNKVEKLLNDKNNLSSDMEFNDLMVGHSYFMAESSEALELKWEYEVIPLLKEYQKDGLLKQSLDIEAALSSREK